MIRRLRQILTALAAMAIAVVLLVGVPVALIRSVGWPLPTTWPTLDELARTAQIGVADTTIIKTLAVIVWLAWMQIATALVVETVAFARRTAARRLPLLPGLQPIAARLVATIALIAAATSTPRPGAMVVPLEVAVATSPQAMPAEAPTMDRPSPDARSARPHAETTVITTSNRDTWWRLAEQHLDDGLRWRELRDLNLDREVAPDTIIDAETDQLQAGWRLLIPTDGTEPAGATEGASDPVAGEWHVQRGDNFWHIAEQTLTDAWDRTPSDAEIIPYWRETIEINRDRLAAGDPNLIHPGQRFITPGAFADPLAGPSDTAAPSDQPEQAIDEGRPDPTPAEDRAAAVPEEAVPPAGDWEAAIRRPATNVAPDHAEGDMHRQAPADQDDDARNALGVPANLPAGLAAAGLVGAGVVATLRWRRRAALRSRTPGYRLPTPLPEAAPQETRLQTAALPERTLDDLVWLLASIPEDVHPALVTNTGDGTVMLLFDDTQPVPDPPDPWTLADDGTDGPVGWSATIDVRGPERSVGLPLLVTLGDAGPTTVYANVAAIGTLTIAGPDDAVRRRLQTMALEAATSRVALPVEVAVVGDDLLATLEQVRHVTDLTPEIDAAVAEVERNIIRDDRTSRLLIAHDPDLAPAVPKSLVGTVGAIAPAGDHPARWTLKVNDDRTGRLRLPDGGQVDLALPHLDPTVADSELVRLDGGATVPMTDDTPAEPVAHPSTNGKPPAAAAVASKPAWCEVRLLGPVQVHRDGQQLEDISPRTMEVLTYLATHRDGGVSKERLDDAVWAGKRAPPGSQRVIAAMTKLRQALGDGPDGQPLVPRRTKSDRIVLSDHVGCDLDRAYAHIALSRDLPDQAAIKELDAALALIRGEPLEDLPVSWASETTQRAVIELQQAALEAARAHRGAGDYDAAEHAIRQGLKLYDPNDHLYLELAQVAAACGHREQVDTIWRQLRKRHADEADEIAGSVSWPPREVELEFQRLRGAPVEG